MKGAVPMPAALSASRTAAAMATAPGESPCTQMLSARIFRMEPSMVRTDGLHGVDDGPRLGGVRDDRVVQAAVRLDVADPAAFRGGQGLQGTDLVDDVVRQLVRIDVEEAAA